MRVLYVLRYYPTLSETFVYREIEALQALGVHVEVAALGERADGALADRLPRVVVHRPPRGTASLALVGPVLGALGSAEGRQGLQAAGSLRRKDAARATWLGALARGFDQLHAHFAGEAALWCRVASRISGVPWSVTTHAADLFVPHPELPALLAEARPVVTISAWHQDWLRAHHQAESVVVPCGVEPERFAPAAPDSPGPLRLVTVARWVEKKGLDTLVAAVSRMEEPVSLRLVSEPPAPLSDARITAGAAPPSAIPALLQAAHLFVLPCRVADSGDQDGLPIALLEAMATALPVVTTPIAGIRELVDEAVGWWVEPDDVDGLARLLDSIARDPAERMRRGRAGRARLLAQQRTVEAQAQGLLAAWSQA